MALGPPRAPRNATASFPMELLILGLERIAGNTAAMLEALRSQANRQEPQAPPAVPFQFIPQAGL